MQERSEVKMAKVTVFNFDWPYDPKTDYKKRAGYMATRKHIEETMKAIVVEDSAKEVDSLLVDEDGKVISVAA
jgi:hypothetical protein